MSPSERLRRWRDWFPVPKDDRRIEPVRWFLLEANRLAVTAALLSFVFVSLMLIGTVWTFQIQRILTETPTIETILNTLLSGIILLVSIVVSINSIALSHDITSVETQEERIDATLQFRNEIGQLTPSDDSPTRPRSFLLLMGDVIESRAQALEEAVADSNEEYAEEIRAYTERVQEATTRVDESVTESFVGGDLGVLWLALEVDYGEYVDQSRFLRASYGESLPEDVEARLDDLLHAFRLFAIGKEYFKTIYYNREVSELSRMLLLFSLPAILINASAILAINARLLPSFWFFGLPPILTFVAGVFTVSLVPYILLTSYVLRLATVANRNTAAGPFWLEK